MTKTIAVIPARGGSKGVFRKNLNFVGDRTLLQRAIDSAQSSNIDHILVSTDDVEIMRHAVDCGASCPELRPSELGSDVASSVDVALHSIDVAERLIKASLPDCTTLVWLEPTSPFRNSAHVSEAIELFASTQFNSLVSVCNLERKPENIFKKIGSKLVGYIEAPQEKFSRRQDMQHLCRINSAVYVTSVGLIREKKSFINQPIGSYHMSDLDSINIDSELDLAFAQMVASKFSI